MKKIEPKFSGEQLNDLLNNRSESDELYAYEKDVIRMLHSFGEKIGHSSLARIAAQMDMICTSGDQQTVAHFKEILCQQQGWEVPEVVQKYTKNS